MRFGLRDLVGIAAIIAFFFAILAPGMSAVRERSRRVACSANLGAIGRGVSAYALDHNGALPRAYFARRVSFLPVKNGASGQPTAYVRNSQNLFLIAKLKYIANPRVFQCPSQNRPNPDIIVFDGQKTQTTQAIIFSYDSLNMAGPTPRFAVTSSLPYVADANPLFAGDHFNPVDPSRSNSPNHRGRTGQNVLYMDGSARWRHSPNCGHHGDNIWQAGQLTRYTGTEVQESERDTFLVP
jgi:hypothetical protein